MISAPIYDRPVDGELRGKVHQCRRHGLGERVNCAVGANSFQLVSKPKMPAVAMPLRASGNVTFQNACQVVVP